MSDALKANVRTTPAREPSPPAATNGDALDMTPLSGMVGFMVRVVQQQIFQEFYEALGKEGMTTGTFSALSLIRANPGVRQGVLANAMMVKRSNMTKLVQRLEAAGLIVRRADDGDARSVNLDLTVKGRRLIDKVAPRLAAFNLEVTRALSVHERQILLALLGKLSEDWHTRRGNGAG
jgi:DNA-binding MarR family transcriptional regulator